MNSNSSARIVAWIDAPSPCWSINSLAVRQMSRPTTLTVISGFLALPFDGGSRRGDHFVRGIWRNVFPFDCFLPTLREVQIAGRCQEQSDGRAHPSSDTRARERGESQEDVNDAHVHVPSAVATTSSPPGWMYLLCTSSTLIVHHHHYANRSRPLPHEPTFFVFRLAGVRSGKGSQNMEPKLRVGNVLADTGTIPNVGPRAPKGFRL